MGLKFVLLNEAGGIIVQRHWSWSSSVPPPCQSSASAYSCCRSFSPGEECPSWPDQLACFIKREGFFLESVKWETSSKKTYTSIKKVKLAVYGAAQWLGVTFGLEEENLHPTFTIALGLLSSQGKASYILEDEYNIFSSGCLKFEGIFNFVLWVRGRLCSSWIEKVPTFTE